MYGTLWGNGRFTFLSQTRCYTEENRKGKPLEGFPLSLFCSFSYVYLNRGKPSDSFPKNIRLPGCFGVAGVRNNPFSQRASIITLMNKQFIASPLDYLKPKGRRLIS